MVKNERCPREQRNNFYFSKITMVDQTPLQDVLKSPIERSDLQTFIRDEISAKNEYITELYKNYYMYGNDR
jgi:hypothetical protein